MSNGWVLKIYSTVALVYGAGGGRFESRQVYPCYFPFPKRACFWCCMFNKYVSAVEVFKLVEW